MKAESVVVAFLSLFIAGTAAETCQGDYSTIYCMFGCCSETYVAYCCLSNGAGIGIIIGVIVFVAGIAGLICRRRYVARTTYVHGSPGVSVVQSSTAQCNLGYAQAPPPYSVAPNAY